MDKRKLRNGAIVVVTLGVLSGLGTMVASAATRPGGAPSGNVAQPGNNPAGPLDPSISPTALDPSNSPTPFDPSAGPSSPAPTDVDADLNSCVAVQPAGQQDGGRLCTTVRRTGLRVDQARVTLTVPAGACQGDISFHLDAGQDGTQNQNVACDGTDQAAATFTVGRDVTNGTLLCGSVDGTAEFAAARSCVRVTAGRGR